MTAFAPVRTWNGSEWITTYPDLFRGLIARWAFGPTNEHNSLALDISRRGANHADVGSDVEYGADSPVGESYYLNGTGAELSHDEIVFDDAEAYTFSLWLRVAEEKDNYVLPFGRSSSSETIYFSAGDGTSDPIFRYRGLDSNDVIADTHNWFDGNWHSITWRVSSDRTVDVFDNGDKIDSAVISNTSIGYTNIGNGYGNQSYAGVGDFSDIRIYDRRLSDAEIGLLYERGNL